MANLTQVNQNDFQQKVIDNSRSVLVDFYADWCGPCRAQAPILEVLASEYADRVDIVKLDVDQDGAIAGQYNVRSIPTLILFKDGKAVNVQVGVNTANQLKAIIDQAL
ncbi:MAG: thioredoxin [Cellvibrionaceae bacterium]|nr:thioredoxin [Cellvibrionaceae bacterium]